MMAYLKSCSHQQQSGSNIVKCYKVKCCFDNVECCIYVVTVCGNNVEQMKVVTRSVFGNSVERSGNEVATERVV